MYRSPCLVRHGTHPSQAGAKVYGASASAITTLGRCLYQLPCSKTSCSAPSTSTLRKSISDGAYRLQSSSSVISGAVMARQDLPNSDCADRALLSIMVDRP